MYSAQDKFNWFITICVGFLCVLYSLRPVADPDFWWHLKTGEEMFRTHGLLQGDPFGFSSDALLSARERTILHGYWLWQLLYYAGYALAGFPGVVALNLLVVLTIYGMLARFLARTDPDKVLSALLLLLSFGAFFTYYNGFERPQICSFLFGLLLVALLDRFRDRRELSRWLFPLMLLWGNIHGGVVVGIGLLFLFMLGVGIQLRNDWKLLTKSFYWAVGGMVCGLLSPSGLYVIPESLRMFTGQMSVFVDVVEYVSTLKLFHEGNYWVVCLWLLMIGHGSGLIFSRRRWLPDLFIYLAVTVVSLWYARNIALFAVCLLPQTAYYLKSAGLCRVGLVRQAAWAGCAVLLILLFWRGYQRQEVASAATISSFYPVALTEFVRQAGVGGKVFNDYDWGGFLLWKLAPETRFFWDGRCLEETVYDHARRIRWTSPVPVAGRAEYEYLLGKYGVEYIIQKNISKIGLTEPLMRNLLKDENWIPVYQDDLGYVIVSNVEKYRRVIERYRIEKAVFLQNLLTLYQNRISATGDPQLFMGRGELYLYMDNLPAARRDLLIARQALGQEDYLGQLLTKAGL